MKGHSKGYVLLYPLLFLTLFGLLAAGVLPRYTAWYREARLTYEAERLAGELRLLRQASRLSLMRYTPGDTLYYRPEFRYNEGDRSYWLVVHRHDEKNWLRKEEIRRYQLPPGMSLQMSNATHGSQLNWLTFGFNGGTSSPTTFRLTYDKEEAYAKKVVVNAAGRIRVLE